MFLLQGDSSWGEEENQAALDDQDLLIEMLILKGVSKDRILNANLNNRDQSHLFDDEVGLGDRQITDAEIDHYLKSGSEVADAARFNS